METRVETLKTMMEKTRDLMTSIGPEDLSNETPCEGLSVEQLQEHVAVWSLVFDAAVNDGIVDFDPSTHTIGPGRIETFAKASESIVAGLTTNGFDRMMTMTKNPLPGEFVLNMLLMEYVGHGWDFARSIGIDHPFANGEAETALAAATAIIEPKYRGTGMFDEVVDVADDAPAMDRFIAFLGRNPNWTPSRSG